MGRANYFIVIVLLISLAYVQPGEAKGCGIPTCSACTSQWGSAGCGNGECWTGYWCTFPDNSCGPNCYEKQSHPDYCWVDLGFCTSGDAQCNSLGGVGIYVTQTYSGSISCESYYTEYSGTPRTCCYVPGGTSACDDIGQSCSSGDTCCSRECNGVCCYGDNSECSSNSECCSGSCSGGICVSCTEDGDTCSLDGDCCSNYCEGSPSYTSRCCSSSPTSDGWYGGGNTAGCGDDPSSSYRNYYCDSSGNQAYEITSTQDCDGSDTCSNICSGTSRYQYRDYYVIADSGSCTSTWGPFIEDCATKSSTDSDGSSTAYTTGGTVTDYIGCSGGACTYNTYSDSCSGTTLTEYGASGSSYTSSTYQCQNYESYYCSGNNVMRREWGCCGTPGYCADSCVADTLIYDCDSRSSQDSDGGNVPLTFGILTDFTTCSGTNCLNTTYSDTCGSSTSLTEYYPSGISYATQTYTCSNFEVAASDTYGNDPSHTETCTGGTGATCSGGRFITYAGSSGTDTCQGTCGTGPNSCVFREYYPIDSDDACPGLDTCTSTTYDADTNSNTCLACRGSGYWNIGGISNCCGDDNNEYKRTRLAYEPVMENGYSDLAGDDACCSSSNSCVHNSACTAAGSSGPDVDGDTDTDYCHGGTWYDCNTNSNCQQNQICWLTVRDCISADGHILIKNLGVPGIEDANDEFTSVRTVVLRLNYTSVASSCRYSNADNNITPPVNDARWTNWEICTTDKPWELSEGSGLKFVHYQINNSVAGNFLLVNKSDDIYYNSTGAGLDTTPPFPPTIVDGDYTNNNILINISWYGAYDPESEILNIPLIYNFILYTPSLLILNNITTTNTAVSSSVSLDHADIVYANVTVINSGGLTSTAQSDGLTIDLNAPTVTVYGSYFAGIDVSLPSNENTWIPATSVNFSWQGNDDLSGIAAYSYILAQDPGTVPDTIPEGSSGNYENQVAKSYTVSSSGKYYFSVRTQDKAGNWGSAVSINFSVDNSPPSQPQILSEAKDGSDITYYWSESSDLESGVSGYSINITGLSGYQDSKPVTELSYTFTGLPDDEYYATVGAVNGVGLWSWSGVEHSSTDSLPPVITIPDYATSVTYTPIIKVWTDETASCTLDTSFGPKSFAYTNTTYHETKAAAYTDTPSFDVTCVDNSGNSAPATFNLYIDPTLTPDTIMIDDINTYQDILTVVVAVVSDGITNLTGVSSDRFSTYINDVQVDSNIYDLGTGIYNISFFAPTFPGSYVFTIKIDDLYFQTVTMTVNPLNLNLIYTDTEIIIGTNLRRITYYSVSDRTIGLATESEIDLPSPGPNLDINVPIESGILVFNTKNIKGISTRDQLLVEQRLLTLNNPSFGYSIENVYITQYRLSYPGYDFVTDDMHVTRGTINYIIKNMVRDTKQFSFERT